ncbi:MAG: PQQ-dependent sugar dehydrogenase [Planctomycetota bacterium]
MALTVLGTEIGSARAADPLDLSDPLVAPGTQLRDIDDVSPGRLTVSLSDFITGTNDLAFPTDVAFDALGRAWVTQVQGQVKIIEPNGALRPEPALDVGDHSDFAGQRDTGTTAVAPHPDFLNPGTPGYGKVYTIESGVDKDLETGSRRAPQWFVDWSDFTHPYDGTRSQLSIGNHRSVVYEYTFTDPLNPNVATSTQREVLSLHQNHHGHNLGDLLFNPTATPGSADYGVLYVSSGDGGNGNGWELNANAPDNVYGGILRIDPIVPTDEFDTPIDTPDRKVFYGVDPAGRVVGESPTAPPIAKFSVPIGADASPFGDVDPSDPLDELEAQDLVWATGLRNPYRLSIDRLTGEMWSSNTGQLNVESIEKVVRGGDYGWGQMEGDFFYLGGARDQDNAPTWIGGKTPAELADPGLLVVDTNYGTDLDNKTPRLRNLTQEEINRLTDARYRRPIFQWDHTDGNSSIGGFVYRGEAFPELYGMAVFADFQGKLNPEGESDPDPFRDFSRLGGRLLYGDPTLGPNAPIHEFNLDAAGLDLPFRMLGLGEDADGELYIYGFNADEIGNLSGVIYEIRPVTGDLNLDGVADLNDVNAAVMALANPALYESTYGVRPGLRADFTGDGVFNLSDLTGFTNLMNTTPAAMLSALPEPGTAAALTVLASVLIPRRRDAAVTTPRPRR